MDDLVVRLKSTAKDDLAEVQPSALQLEAAAEIERLRAKLGEPRAEVDLAWSQIQYAKIQEFICNNRLYKGLPNHLSHADITIQMASRLLIKGAPWDDLADAERYRWLRQRLEIRLETAYKGSPRPAIMTRLGRTFIDTPLRPRDDDVEKAAHFDSAVDDARNGSNVSGEQS